MGGSMLPPLQTLSLRERQPVPTAADDEDDMKDWPPLPDWAWNLAPLGEELGEYYKRRCEDELKRLVKLKEEAEEERDQAAILAMATHKQTQRLERQLQAEVQSNTKALQMARERVVEKDALIEEKKAKMRMLRDKWKQAQKDYDECDRILKERDEAVGKLMEQATIARDNLVLNNQQLLEMAASLRDVSALRDKCNEELAKCKERNAYLEELVKKQADLMQRMGKEEEGKDEDEKNLPALEPHTPPGSPLPEPKEAATKAEQLQDAHVLFNKSDSIRQRAIKETEAKLDDVTRDWQPPWAPTDKETQLRYYKMLVDFLKEDLEALNDSRNHALAVVLLRVAHEYLKYLTPLAFDSSKFWTEEMAKLARTALFGLQYVPQWAENFRGFANVGQEVANQLEYVLKILQKYVSKKKPGYKAFLKVGKLQRNLQGLLDKMQGMLADKKIQYFTSRAYNKNDHRTNTYKLCDALPLFVELVDVWNAAKAMCREVVNAPNLSDPSIHETLTKVQKNLNSLGVVIVAISDAMRDDDRSPREQTIELFHEILNWVGMIEDTLLDGVPYEFDGSAYWSRKGN